MSNRRPPELEDIIFVHDLIVKLDSRADDIDKTLVRMEALFEAQHETLKEHTRRSVASENRIEAVEKFQTQALAIIGFLLFVASTIGLLDYFKR